MKRYILGKMSSPTEIFEKIAHPMRIRILKILEASPMAFGRLKNELGLSSSGNLDFHLKKLEGLIVIDSDGLYRLSDEGKEALEAIKYHYVIVDYFVKLKGGILKAGSDAEELRWVSLDDVEKYDLTQNFRSFFQKRRQELKKLDSRQ